LTNKQFTVETVCPKNVADHLGRQEDKVSNGKLLYKVIEENKFAAVGLFLGTGTCY